MCFYDEYDAATGGKSTPKPFPPKKEQKKPVCFRYTSYSTTVYYRHMEEKKALMPEVKKKGGGRKNQGSPDMQHQFHRASKQAREEIEKVEREPRLRGGAEWVGGRQTQNIFICPAQTPDGRS